MSAGARKSRLVVAIVAYGAEDHLASCLASLRGELPVIVVDNGASDEASSLCRAWGAQYVRSPDNVGFAVAVNSAIAARGDDEHLLLLNPDARITPEDAQLLVGRLESSPDLAAVAPRLLFADGSDQKTVWPMPSPWVATLGLIGLSDRLAKRYFLSGAVLVLRGEAIGEVGRLDERFFLYAEEADWQMRALRAGWRVEVIPDVRAVHVGGATSTDNVHRQQLFNASAELFVRKWYGKRGWTVFRVASILVAVRRWLMSTSRQARDIQARALVSYLRGPVRHAGRGREPV